MTESRVRFQEDFPDPSVLVRQPRIRTGPELTTTLATTGA
jgi:hypothetical protein